MKTYKIYLIRHGETAANREGRYIGRTDLSLTERGEQMLEKMKKEFAYPAVGRVYTSPLLRCRQTAEILYPGHACCEIKGLIECDFGRFEGKTAAELLEDPAFLPWIKGESTQIPQGESNHTFFARCVAAYEQIFLEMNRDHITEAAVICHGGVMMAILSQLAYPKKPPNEWIAGNGMGYETWVIPQLWMRDRVIEAVEELPYGIVTRKEQPAADEAAW